MGLDTTHDCWSGAYSAFHRWRCEVAKVVGIPLELMEGFYREPYFLEQVSGTWESQVDMFKKNLPIKWDLLKEDPIHILLHHSDCEGEIEWKDCEPLAMRLTEIKSDMPEGDGGGHIRDWKDKTQQFIDGLLLAHERKENVEFH